MKKWMYAVVPVIMIVFFLLGYLHGAAKLEMYLKTGKYQEAYAIAQGDDERAAVLAENAVAVCYQDFIRDYQDFIGVFAPTLDRDKMTFDLYAAWYDHQEHYVVLKGTFHAGNDSEVGYVLYEGKKSTFSYAFASSDLDPDSYEKTGDDRQDLAEKIFRTTEIRHINDTMSNGFSVMEIGRIITVAETSATTIQLLPEAIP